MPQMAIDKPMEAIATLDHKGPRTAVSGQNGYETPPTIIIDTPTMMVIIAFIASSYSAQTVRHLTD